MTTCLLLTQFESFCNTVSVCKLSLERIGIDNEEDYVEKLVATYRFVLMLLLSKFKILERKRGEKLNIF